MEPSPPSDSLPPFPDLNALPLEALAGGGRLGERPEGFRSGFVALVGHAAVGARALVGLVGGGDAWVLVPASPSPSALACTASSGMTGTNRSRIAPLLTRRISPGWVL